jgi:hypothetical protein
VLLESNSSVAKVGFSSGPAAHGLQPHRIKTFKLSMDPEFASKLRDIVGLSSIRRRTLWS